MAGRLLALPLLLCLSAGTMAGTLQLGGYYTDESNGFKIQVPRKWEQVPTKFQEVSILGKWGAKQKREWPPPILFVLRFLEPGVAEQPDEPGDALRPGIPDYRDMLRYQEKSVWEFTENFFWSKHQVVEDDNDLKMSSKKFRAHLRVYKQPGGEGKKTRELGHLIMAVAAEIRTVEPSDSSYGVVFLCSQADEEDMIRSFKRCIQRFKILEFDEEDEPEEGEARLSDADIFVDSSKKPETWRAARKKKLEGLKDWDALDTPNYLIVYNKEVKRPLLRKIAQHIEAIRSQVYAELFPPAKEITAISVVRVCKDRAEYHRYGGPGGSAGYWSRGDEELVFYQDSSNKKDSLRVLYHEAFHQYIHYAVGDVAPHSWFNEGHGDYFAGHNYSARKFKAAPFRWRTGIIANALARKSYVPLEKFLKYTQGEYYANPGLCYAQGWSFVYFLREVERRKIRKYKQYWGLLDKYFAAIKRNVKQVKDGGLYGLEEPPPPPPDDSGPADEGDAPEEEQPEVPAGPSVPGLEKPFPGENPLEGEGEEEAAGDAEPDAPGGRSETRTVAGPKITGTKSALDAAVDEVFRGIDLSELEKDWIEFSK